MGQTAVGIFEHNLHNHIHAPTRYHIGNYNKLINIDLSSVVIEQQAAKFPEQIWKVMNAMNMDFQDASFPVIIDKSLIDTLLCASQR